VDIVVAEHRPGIGCQGAPRIGYTRLSCVSGSKEQNEAADAVSSWLIAESKVDALVLSAREAAIRAGLSLSHQATLIMDSQELDNLNTLLDQDVEIREVNPNHGTRRGVCQQKSRKSKNRSPNWTNRPAPWSDS